MSRYSTEPGPADLDHVRAWLNEAEIASLAQDPTFVAAYLAGIVDDVTEVDDPIMARRFAYGRALIDMVEEELQ